MVPIDSVEIKSKEIYIYIMLLSIIFTLFLLNTILVVFSPKLFKKQNLQTQLKLYTLSAILDILLAILFYFVYIFTK